MLILKFSSGQYSSILKNLNIVLESDLLNIFTFRKNKVSSSILNLSVEINIFLHLTTPLEKKFLFP